MGTDVHLIDQRGSHIARMLCARIVLKTKTSSELLH
jgi:hypothetical protein